MTVDQVGRVIGGKHIRLQRRLDRLLDVDQRPPHLDVAVILAVAIQRPRAPHHRPAARLRADDAETDCPLVGMLKPACSVSFMMYAGALTDARAILAGAFHTVPFCASLAVQTPAMMPLGGAHVHLVGNHRLDRLEDWQRRQRR